MLAYFLTLGISEDASDERVREAYLSMVKKHPPERDPERFQKINGAYEAIKDKRARVKTKMFSSVNRGDLEAGLLEFANARPVRRRRAGLDELIEANEKIRMAK
jgi:DnaJ-class molecular chaperone